MNWINVFAIFLILLKSVRIILKLSNSYTCVPMSMFTAANGTNITSSKVYLFKQFFHHVVYPLFINVVHIAVDDNLYCLCLTHHLPQTLLQFFAWFQFHWILSLYRRDDRVKGCDSNFEVKYSDYTLFG